MEKSISLGQPARTAQADLRSRYLMQIDKTSMSHRINVKSNGLSCTPDKNIKTGVNYPTYHVCKAFDKIFKCFGS